MISLALDTATDRLTLALGRPGAPMLERRLDGVRRHAAALVPLLEELLAESGLALGGVSRLGVADGPGGFTGLRVGAALAKALARAHPGLSVWTASTLLVRAAGASPSGGGRVLVATSALRGEVFAAFYRFLPGAVETMREPALATFESLAAESPDLVVADLPEPLMSRLGDQFSVPLIRGTDALPRASALLALMDLPGGARQVRNLDDWEPTYGRPAEAQARWEATHGKRLPDSARSSG